MPTKEVGIFRLIDWPEGQDERITKTIEAIDFPWERVESVIADDPDGKCLVNWDSEIQQNSTGLFYNTYEIVLGTRYGEAFYTRGNPFDFSHEVGHLIDQALLTNAKRQKLLDLMHASPGPFDSKELNGEPHPYAHVHVDPDTWRGQDKYAHKPYEAFCDLFVATFAPGIWDGTALDDIPKKWPRFTHWTENLSKVREIVLAEDEAVTPEPTPTPTPSVGSSHPGFDIWGHLIFESYKEARGPDYDPMIKDLNGFTHWMVRIGHRDTAKEKIFEVNLCRYLLAVETKKPLKGYEV